MPFEPGEHDSELWVPDSARAAVVKEAPPAGVMLDNHTDLTDESILEFFQENTAMFGFGQETRYMSYASEGTMMARSKWRPPQNVIEEIAIARDYAERDDDIASAIGAILAAAYHGGYDSQHEDEQVEHTFSEMSEDIGLLGILHEMHRELLISAQINTCTVFTRESYDIRPENVSRVISRSVAAPLIGVLPAEQIRVVGADLFGEGTLGYVAEGSLAQWLREYWGSRTSEARKREMRLKDPLAAALFIGKIDISYMEMMVESTSLLSTGMDLYALNPQMVHRSTLPKGSWRYPRPLLTRNLPLLEAKRLLTVMDHALLQGGINYIVVAKKGDKDKPATQPEMANLQGLVQRASRSGVLIGDHRIELDIIQPELKEMLNPDKRQMLGRKLSQALLRVPEFGSDETGNAVQTFTEVAQAVMTDDRNLVVGHVHRYIWRECMKRNASVFGRSDRPTIWTPKIILQGLNFWTQYLLKLYDRGDLPRKYMVEFGGYDYKAVKAQKAREVAGGHDEIFAPPAVPYSAPGQGNKPGADPNNPYHYGNPGGPNDNGGGRPPGAPNRDGGPPDRVRPTRVVRRTPGETVRAVWNEDEETVVRIGEITERVLGEYPDATLGRLTAAERAGIEARHTTNEGNVLIVPVNPGYELDDLQAVRLSDGFSMLVGHRVPDGAIMARAFCFREPAFVPHEAENTVVRWGFPIELMAAPSDATPDDGDDILSCPSCGATSPMDAEQCTDCGFDGPPFSLPAAQRRALQPQQPLAIHLTVNGTEVTAAPAPAPAPAPAKPAADPALAPPPDPGPPPGWASHETELLFRALMGEKNLWDAALEFASQNRQNAEAVAKDLQSRIVPREMLQRIASNGFDPRKVDWLQIAHQLVQRADLPRPKEPK